MKKKTYVFNERVIQILNELKKRTNKKETQIIEDALMHYYEYLMGRDEIFQEMKRLSKNLIDILNKVEELSYRLGKCEAEKEFLQKG
ncbi:MAG TPA: hypothetical protein EYP32_07130 [Aquificaceae bacterium]|nr:hypothetical protein [Aquificaceae bacterium]HIQ48558.1 hypothetical protein [Aquifex aeolicus]